MKPALLFVIVGLLCLNLQHQLSSYQLRTKVLAAQTEYATQQARQAQLNTYWQNIVTVSPTYRDGFIQLALIAYRSGNSVVAKRWLAHAYLIDPNYRLPSTLSFLQQLVQ